MTLTLTPEKKREAETEMAKFLRHLGKDETERRDVIGVKSLNLSMHPRPISAAVR